MQPRLKSSRRISSTIAALELWSWHSQNRSTEIPSMRSWRLLPTSLCWFLAIFAFQNGRFRLGTCPHRGQPCQKHPSTKTANCSAGKKKSGLPIMWAGCSRHPRTPDRTSHIRRRTSVDRLPRPRTRDISWDRCAVTPTNPPSGSLDLRDFSTDSNAFVEKGRHCSRQPE